MMKGQEFIDRILEIIAEQVVIAKEEQRNQIMQEIMNTDCRMCQEVDKILKAIKECERDEKNKV